MARLKTPTTKVPSTKIDLVKDIIPKRYVDCDLDIDLLDYVKRAHHIPLRLGMNSINGALIKIEHTEEAEEQNISLNARSRGMQGQKCTYDGQSFDSMWELAFYRYHKEIMFHSVQRNYKDFVTYIDHTGEARKFYYDFVVNGEKYEVKGIWRDKDLAKKAACESFIHFVDKVQIIPMIKELNKKFPNWRDDAAKK